MHGEEASCQSGQRVEEAMNMNLAVLPGKIQASPLGAESTITGGLGGLMERGASLTAVSRLETMHC